MEKTEEERQLDRPWYRWETNIVNKCYRNVGMRTCNTLMTICIFLSTVITLSLPLNWGLIDWAREYCFFLQEGLQSTEVVTKERIYSLKFTKACGTYSTAVNRSSVGRTNSFRRASLISTLIL
jgi:hypothetical protein